MTNTDTDWQERIEAALALAWKAIGKGDPSARVLMDYADVLLRARHADLVERVEALERARAKG